jgi:hypothetical protein
VVAAKIASRAAGLIALLFALLPEAVWACPFCAQSDSGGAGRILALGAMIVFPFVLVPGIIYLIRKSNDQDLPY